MRRGALPHPASPSRLARSYAYVSLAGGACQELYNSEDFWSHLMRVPVSRTRKDGLNAAITKLMGAARRGDIERCT